MPKYKELKRGRKGGASSRIDELFNPNSKPKNTKNSVPEKPTTPTKKISSKEEKIRQVLQVAGDYNPSTEEVQAAEKLMDNTKKSKQDDLLPEVKKAYEHVRTLIPERMKMPGEHSENNPVVVEESTETK